MVRVRFAPSPTGSLHLGNALTAAANVRTLALVEVLMAQVVSRRVFAQAPSARETLGMGLIVLGVVGILATAH